MPASRRITTVRIVPLDSPEAGESRVDGTATERLALVRQLSVSAWALMGRPLPTYTRSTIPIVIRRLGDPPTDG